MPRGGGPDPSWRPTSADVAHGELPAGIAPGPWRLVAPLAYSWIRMSTRGNPPDTEFVPAAVTKPACSKSRRVPT